MGPEDRRHHLAATVLSRLLTSEARLPPHILVPDTGGPSTERHGAKHTSSTPRRRTLAELWASEGEEPAFEPPRTLVDLQIWHRGALHFFEGEEASRRLAVLAPTVFAEHVGDRNGAVAQAYIGDRMGFRLTGSTLARSYAGATGIMPRDIRRLADSMLQSKWRPRELTGQTKNTRFFDCVTRVFGYFRLLEQRFNNTFYSRLGKYLSESMLQQGRCRTAPVEAYLDSLQVILHGNQYVKHDLHRWVLSLDKSARAALWRTQRLFSKDDNDPVANAVIAMKRMTVPVARTPEDDRIAMKVMNNFQRRAAAFVAEHAEELKSHHDRASLHRSAATIFFTRKLGGGAAELHLTVALYRLAHGIPSTLQDVWGHTPEQLTVDELFRTMDASSDIRKEVTLACSWMLDELERRKVSFPYLCIYPAREVKSRCFMLLPYAIQQGGYQAATTVGRYLRNREDTREVYRGFEDSAWIRKLHKDIEAGATHLLSLDSQVSTDPLPHGLCRMVFEPFYPVFSEYTIKAVEKTFSPTRVHVARERPKDFLRKLTFNETVLSRLSVSLRTVQADLYHDVITRSDTIRVHPHQLPRTIRTAGQAKEIATALKDFGRVMLKAPTGSGKTVLASTLFNAIVQFPSVAALELMSQYLTLLKVPHNVRHARRKTDPLEWDESADEPRTILCTSFYVQQLSRQYSSMVVVLDEAETKQENYILNVEWSRRVRRKCLLMSATPDELAGEESTHLIELQGGTNFPVAREKCTYTEMQEMLSSAETPKSLVCAHSEPLCEKLAALVRSSGRKAFALTARMRARDDYLQQIADADVILATNAIRSSVTLPDVEFVFDLGRIYETIDFPLSGLESLVLSEVSEAMRLQCEGRVGRVKPGTYYHIVDPPGSAIPWNSAFLGRAPVIARQSDRVALHRYSRPLGAGSIIVERFSQAMAARAGVRAENFCPLWASVIRQLAPHHTAKLVATVAFEALGIVNRTRQVATDVDMRAPYDSFVKEAARDYHTASRALLRELQKNGWFPSEIAQIDRWTIGLDVNDTDGIDSAHNLRAVSLALWRQIANARGGQLVGRYRNFSCNSPCKIEDGSAYVVLGLSLFQTQVTARWALQLPEEVVSWLDQLVREVGEVTVCEDAVGVSVPAVLGWDVALENDGRQRRRLELSYDHYTRCHVFQPEDADRIWEHMKKSVEDVRVGKDEVTVQGSPMSATASFTVLNSFGLAAHDSIRDGLHSDEGIQEPHYGASIFGDDDIRCGTEAALRAGTRDRESLGLQTKWSATGMARIAEEGKLIGNSDQMGVFTERLLDLEKLRIVPSLKPAGLLRLFQASNPTALPLSTVSHRADMLSFEKGLHISDPRWAKLLLTKARGQQLVARRETAPRHILSQLFKRRITAADRVATGDVARLFDHLELMLLQVCPSTKGAPDRVVEGVADPLGHPIISLADARMFAEYLQGEDCHFKLHGPPLQLHGGPWAHEMATALLNVRGIPTVQESHRYMQMLGWGSEPPNREQQQHIPEDEEWRPLDPIEFGDDTI